MYHLKLQLHCHPRRKDALLCQNGPEAVVDKQVPAAFLKYIFNEYFTKGTW